MFAIAKVITLFLIFHLLILPLTLADGTETQTNLHFYFHDQPGGSNPTAIRVAAASVTSTSPTGFGATVMMDDPLTAGPDVSSALVGRAQGLYALASRDEGGHLLMAMNLVFMDQENNGSTLAVLGRNNVFDPIREMPVIGGSGKFRYARGYIHAKTYTFDQTTGNAVVEYNVTVFHQGQGSA
ncbi:Dirigent protein [Rhynchospora pubera]|uniref:Dirigent protein n=1 Tax=Rhynchospora pubera TaxID=906938 RepID=A0AAV8GHE7_9POAL|nr:Dirigent protein [Rhynchospora pubera]KAJ4802278.1 Dirigent protein [Rhynchospora pubera]